MAGKRHVWRIAAMTPKSQKRFSPSTPPFGSAEVFHAALVDARDYMGFALAKTWSRLTPDYFTYLDVARGDDRN